MRAVVVFPLAALFLAAPPLGAEEWTKRFNVSAKANLRVAVDDGRIEARPGGAGFIEARVIAQGWRIAPDEVRVIDRQNGDQVELEVRIPRRNWNFTGHRSLRVELLLPPELAGDFRTGDGSITLSRVRGDLHLATGDGSIEADALDGALDARTGDGRISVRGRFDSLSLRTGDGAVSAVVESGSKMAGPWRVHTGDGSVTVRLPTGFGADIEARTGDGGINVDLPVTTNGRISENHFSGKLGGGGLLFRIETNDGSIRLDRL